MSKEQILFFFSQQTINSAYFTKFRQSKFPFSTIRSWQC